MHVREPRHRDRSRARRRSLLRPRPPARAADRRRVLVSRADRRSTRWPAASCCGQAGGVQPGGRAGRRAGREPCCSKAIPRSRSLRLAKELPADLLVRGPSPRRALKHFLLGSMSEELLRRAPCPVMTVRHGVGPAPATGTPFRRILCATDLHAEASDVVSYAVSLAQALQAELTLLHVLERVPQFEPGSGVVQFSVAEVHAFRQGLAEEARERLRAIVSDEDRERLAVRDLVKAGRAHEQILRVALEEGSQLVVLGDRGHGAAGADAVRLDLAPRGARGAVPRAGRARGPRPRASRRAGRCRVTRVGVRTGGRLEVSAGLLYDATQCIGCDACSQACKEENHLPPSDREDHDRLHLDGGADAARRRARARACACTASSRPASRSARSARSARRPTGPVVYDAGRCIGCRYCIMACPFGVPEVPVGPCRPGGRQVHDVRRHGRGRASRRPAPRCARRARRSSATATTLLARGARAHRATTPAGTWTTSTALDEAGGTSVLMLSGVPFEELGLPTNLPRQPLPLLTWQVLSKVPDFVALARRVPVRHLLDHAAARRGRGAASVAARGSRVDEAPRGVGRRRALRLLGLRLAASAAAAALSASPCSASRGASAPPRT